jgi:hypothetical protein
VALEVLVDGGAAVDSALGVREDEVGVLFHVPGFASAASFSSAWILR